MVETRNSEINIEQLMADIREAVAKRESNGRKSLASASLELHDFLALVDDPINEPLNLAPLALQSEFVTSEDNRYHIDDLLQYHDHRFVWNAYRAILKREPDEGGLNQFLSHLRSGRYDKTDILAILRFSPEGQRQNVYVEGLKPRPLHRRLFRVPVLGYLLEMMVAVFRLPASIHRRRQLEEHVLVQQELLASHMNQLSNATFERTKTLPEKFADLSHEQRKFAELQHHQVVGLFREQREIQQRLEQLRQETNRRIAELNATGGATSADERRNAHQASVVADRNLDQLLAAFADEFRGQRADIKEGLRPYLLVLNDAGITERIIDIGCGRGEWLELLREAGLQGRGVENNSVLVAGLRSRDLDVIEEDALEHLANLPDESLNAVTAFHFVEHLEFETLIDFMDEAARVLRPGGVVILETPNPKNLVVGACNFYSDPTHQRPLFPESMQFILSNRGFANVRIEYVNPAGDSPFGEKTRAAKELDSWLYSPRDFAVIGTKA